MQYKSFKIVLWLALFLLAVVLAYVVLNVPYFWKQAYYALNKQNANTSSTQTGSQVKDEANHLSIPSLNIEAPIVEPTENKESAFQEALKQGVVHYPGSANVGEVGNDYIFGHSSDFAFKGGTFKTVFALLPHIKDGAEIYITNNNGDKFTYKVVSQKVVSPNDTSVLSQDTKGKKILTLQTSYPVGTALKRYIVTSELEQ